MTTHGGASLSVLDGIAGKAHQALQSARITQMLANSRDPNKVQQAGEYAEQTGDLIGAALSDVLQAGGRVVAIAEPTQPIPLHLLVSPANRELLAALEAALPLAERVDAERGRSLPAEALAPGECQGYDLAEAVSEILLRVRAEVLGPKGRD